MYGRQQGFVVYVAGTISSTVWHFETNVYKRLRIALLLQDHLAVEHGNVPYIHGAIDRFWITWLMHKSMAVYHVFKYFTIHDLARLRWTLGILFTCNSLQISKLYLVIKHTRFQVVSLAHDIRQANDSLLDTDILILRKIWFPELRTVISNVY